MKAGLILFLLIIGGIIFFALKMNVAKIRLKDGNLTIYNKKCKKEIFVKVLSKETDMVDEIDIKRYILKLSNGDEIVYEIINLPATRAFNKSYEEILEKIFNMKLSKKFSTDGFVLFKGDFDIALFYKADSELILLYPANNLENILLACYKDNRPQELKKDIEKIRYHKSRWDISLIILDNIINKDI
jgi:hypothetical protein